MYACAGGYITEVMQAASKSPNKYFAKLKKNSSDALTKIKILEGVVRQHYLSTKPSEKEEENQGN